MEVRKNQVMQAYGDDIYIFGGENENGDVSSCYKVNTISGEATKIADIPAEGGKVGSSILVENGYILLVSGLVNGQSTSNVSIYNMNTNSWQIIPGSVSFAFAGTISNYILGGKRTGQKSDEYLSTLYSCEFTPPNNFSMTEICNTIPPGNYFNSLVEYVELTPDFELDITLFFWGGADDHTFYSYHFGNEEEADTLNVYNPRSEDWSIVGINYPMHKLNIKVYPNPVQQTLYIQSAKENVKTIKIFNINGQEVMKLTGDIQNEIEVAHLMKGVYFLEIETINNRKGVSKFIKQ